MKKILGLLLVAGIGFSAGATELVANAKSSTKITTDKTVAGIQFFHGTWAEALAKAKEEKKVIFLDAYASWCGPCKMMAAKTFTKEEVGAFFNANFINYKMDMEKSPDGNRLSNKFSLTAYPTLYFVDGREELVHQTLGYQKPKQLISVGESVLKMK